MAGTGTITISLASNVNPSTFGQGVVWTATVFGQPTQLYLYGPYLKASEGMASTTSASSVTSPFSASPPRLIGAPDPQCLQLSASSTFANAYTGSTVVNLATAFYSFRFQEVSKTGEAPICEMVDTAGALKFRLTSSGTNFIGYDSTGTAAFTITSSLGTGTHTIQVQLGTGAAANFNVYRDGTLLQTGTINSGTVNNGGIRLGSSALSGTYVHNYQFLGIASDAFPFKGPTGTVQFQVDGVNFGSAVTLVDSTGVGNSDTNSPVTATSPADFALTSGTRSITAIYNGDLNYTTLTSSTLSQQLNPGVVGLQHNTAVPSLANAAANPILGDQAGSLLVNTQAKIPTYSVGATGGAFTQTAPTDLAILVGSASKTVKVLRVIVSGTATADTFYNFNLVKRSSADVGSNGSLTFISLDSGNSAPTSQVNLFQGTNASTLGTTVGTVAVRRILLAQAPGVVTVTNQPDRAVFDFTLPGSHPVVLRGAAQGLAINAGGITLPGGASLDLEFLITEDDS